MRAVAIRPLTLGDADRLAIVERDAAERFRGAGLPLVADGDVTNPAFLAAILRKGTAIGATSGEDGLVGFALAGVLDDALHLYELSVARAHGGRGIGNAMLAALDEGARKLGLAALTLSTFSDIPWNAPFYARRGFAGVAEDDWSPGFHLLRASERAARLPLERRIFMRKELQ